MAEKKKVLIVMGGSSMGVGGIESMVINYYRNIDKSKITIDFVFFGEGVGLYDDEILANGGKIFHLPIKSKHYFQSVAAMKQLLNTEKYDIVHANLNAAGIESALRIAKACGVPVRVSHAHSTNHGTTSTIRRMINEYGRKKITRYSTHNFACSDMAGAWYYGNKPYTIVRNAIDTNRFLFSQEVRDRVREEMQVGDKYIVGHIGNLGFPKNQAFLLNAFAAMYKKQPNSELWLVGEGEDLEPLQAQAKELHIEQAVRFLGRRMDVHELLQAMDVFVLPSFFEGFPVVITEAVAADLPCIVSDTITKMVKITPKVSMLSLEDSTEIWSETMLKYQNTARVNRRECIVENGFDIETEAKKLENFYQNGRYA